MDDMYGTLDSKGSSGDGARPSTQPQSSRIIEPKKPMSLHIHVKAILQGITIGASLLPSLRAQHKVTIGDPTPQLMLFHSSKCYVHN